MAVSPQGTCKLSSFCASTELQHRDGLTYLSCFSEFKLIVTVIVRHPGTGLAPVTHQWKGPVVSELSCISLLPAVLSDFGQFNSVNRRKRSNCVALPHYSLRNLMATILHWCCDPENKLSQGRKGLGRKRGKDQLSCPQITGFNP